MLPTIQPRWRAVVVVEVTDRRERLEEVANPYPGRGPRCGLPLPRVHRMLRELVDARANGGVFHLRPVRSAPDPPAASPAEKTTLTVMVVECSDDGIRDIH